jgi:hypothetical protein
MVGMKVDRIPFKRDTTLVGPGIQGVLSSANTPEGYCDSTYVNSLVLLKELLHAIAFTSSRTYDARSAISMISIKKNENSSVALKTFHYNIVISKSDILYAF